MVTKLKFKIFLIILLIEISICMLEITSTGFILIVLWCILLYWLTVLSNLSINTFFDTEVISLWILLFKVLIKLPATTDFPSLSFECISLSFSSYQVLIDLLWNSVPLSTHILFGLRTSSSNIFWEALVTIIPFFLFQRNNPNKFTININDAQQKWNTFIKFA